MSPITSRKKSQALCQKWKTLNELKIVLEIPYNATLALQQLNITLSDVYGIWQKMVLHLKACAASQNFKTKLANHLIDALNARYGTIFNNKEMQCCLYLDPRYRTVILNDPIALEDTKLDLPKKHASNKFDRPNFKCIKQFKLFI